MIQQEGPRSLYRGYSMHIFAIMFWMSVLPLATDFLMEKLPLMIDAGEMAAATAPSRGHAENEGNDQGPI